MSDQRFGVGVVIGASSGIGAATVARLARQTALVHAVSRRGGVSGSGVKSHVADIRSYEQVAELLTTLPHEIDYIVNCAGVGYYAPLTSDYSQAWREIIETNLLGMVNLLAAIEQTERTVRTLAVVSSLAAHQPSTTPGNTVYSAAKTAARTLVNQYRDEARLAGKRLRVVVISPGYVESTGFGERFFEHAPDQAADLFAGRSCLRPEDVAEAIETALSAPSGVEMSEVVIRPTPTPDEGDQ